MQLEELLAYWDSDQGRPYKGKLIDWSRYNGDGKEPPSDLGCACAQGQVLLTIGGWEPERLKSVAQVEADQETARLLNISTAHAILLRQINDSVDGAPSIVLTDPGKVLGDQWSKLLDFWWHMDQMTPADWAAARAAAWYAARDAAWAAARAAAGAAARAAAWYAARDAAWAAAWAAARDAAGEIQGARILREKGRDFYFLPLFGFASPDDIPARPANYGVVSQ
jgi:hypothetical protein